MTYIDDNNLQQMQRAELASTAKMIYSSPNVVCECGSKVFHEAMVLKKVSSFISGTGKDELIHIPVYVCDKCGKIPEEFTSKSAAAAILGEDKPKEESVII